MTKLSFEFFPPKSARGKALIMETMRAFAPFAPDWVSVTYGAGGSTQAATLETAVELKRRFNTEVMAHLTCVGASQAETLHVADTYAAAGLTNILALRGDPPLGQTGFTPHPDGFESSVALIEALATQGRFNIRVGAYPERHPDAADDNADIEWLKRKVEAGASEAITQFFFEAETFLRFRDRCVKAGITVPIIPGILPITHWASTKRMAQTCGAHIPPELDAAFEVAERDGRSELLSLCHATELCSTLREEGVEHLHFYCLNKAAPTQQICAALSLHDLRDWPAVA